MLHYNIGVPSVPLNLLIGDKYWQHFIMGGTSTVRKVEVSYVRSTTQGLNVITLAMRGYGLCRLQHHACVRTYIACASFIICSSSFAFHYCIK